ncbi:hypothetical protein ACHAQA_004019 [Verticillium albo-atrum]
MAPKRTLDAFFTPTPKKPRPSTTTDESTSYSTHKHYPFPILDLTPSVAREITSLPARPAKPVTSHPDLDLLSFEPYIPPALAKHLFTFLRANLPFYRVKYKITRGGVQTDVTTPRYTTVFGLDDTARFAPDGGHPVEACSGAPTPPDSRYDRIPPRPLPACLDALRRSVEAATDGDCVFNFCLVNYYASGADSIAFHSDDERFLGPDPAIASLSLGARRDFLLKHKPVPPGPGLPPGDVKPTPSPTLKFPLGPGDMLLMRGATQGNWLHSVPKRSGKGAEDGGRINITFRRAMVKAGTENYYNYNVGTGPVYRWDDVGREMRVSSG